MPSRTHKHTIHRAADAEMAQAPVDTDTGHRGACQVVPEYLDIRATCVFTSLSRRTIDSAKASGALPYIKCGGKVLLRRGDVIAWLERGRVDVRADLARIDQAGAGGKA